ncbi:MAG: fatty acid desaturase [Candidatus Poseidoniaceae archaeon]|nr:fatty acid desaturase [Candidatus Poseidoniaceae archaeon]
MKEALLLDAAMGDDGGQVVVKSRVDPLNASFLIGTPFLALFGLIWYSMEYGMTWKEPVIFVIMYLTTGFSITAGYHRLFSHRTHSGAWPLRLFYAVFAAGAFENSAIKWSSDHRRHHLKTDTDDDPYSVLRGFFWAHMGWVMVNEGEEIVENVEDLQADSILAWQDRHIFKIGAFSGIIVPGLLGILMLGGWHGFFGGMVWGGLVRLVLVHHGTFLINSGAHYWGSQPYSTKNTSRDSPLLSLFTFGEGYHNFHHTFQADYRNGHRWHQWDPSKWLIKSLSFIGMTSKLHKVPQWTIESARMKMSFEKNKKRANHNEDVGKEYRSRSADCSKRLRAALRELSEKKSEYKIAKQKRKAERKEAWLEKKETMKARMRECKQSISQIRDEFRYLLNEMRISAAAA